MQAQFKTTILNATGATDLFEIEVIQSLWSGYGKIVRYGLTHSTMASVVVKQVHWPQQTQHPRGWNTDLSHRRKIKSYQVESAWYAQWGSRCDDRCRIPRCLALQPQGDDVLMVLEDLNAAGYPVSHTQVSTAQIHTCLSWLANFHATFMHVQATDLWAVGTYWHLDTRPDEWAALDDIALKQAAGQIDQKLRDSPFQTLVHGDAKLANFCFSDDGQQVAAVDFQYVGGGCGMKDVAYFIGSCVSESACEASEAECLAVYFSALKQALGRHNQPVDVVALEQDWRSLYPVAWTDFHRFLKGWSPGHWKINAYSERVARGVLAQLSADREGK